MSRLTYALENKHNRTVDFVLTTVPWTESKIPLMAPAALKPIVEKAGYSCLAVDLNSDVQNIVKKYHNSNDLINFFFNEKVDDPSTGSFIHRLYSEIADDIISWNPKFVGLSLFSYVSQHSAKWISYYIKKLRPSTVIIIGGPGCLDTFVGHSEFVDYVKNNTLVDHHIRGDGEHSLYEFLIGNRQFPGVNDNTWKELTIEELRTLPVPNYDNYVFDSYELPTLPLVGSRGCVRQCKFCDYIENWKHFQWRDAHDVFNEMQEQYSKYKIRRFKFQDSLTNGNMNEFLTLLELLSNYNKNNPSRAFTWSGYYILRNITDRSIYEWDMVAASGAEALAIGIENLNEDIRYHIGKKFSNESLDFHLEQAKKHNIRVLMLNIVGYVFEEQKHIDFIKEWLYNHTQYKDILHIQWGGGLGIFPNTYLDKHKDDFGIVMIGNQKPFEWISTTVNSTPVIRAGWIKELMELSCSLGYSVTDNLDNHFLIEKILNENQSYNRI